ncbi:GlxA family transcriptional regulator [Noviherbaspirillum saxi]|uniref:Helix-turn-helix domain-containing protein n=1 Tax=Noviherbaspirillum saxi TaxID=2320863 RepID=A0A3A3FNN1_9BURK|nr:helix-turn-helix domain-containing protein [Noviherbaspirillum saxi]RJF95279.1 helix-turn-helix domain-containing protein [Noviherbaspirillum saxi]
MNRQQPARVAILAMPETSASVVYGMYDMFMSAGRDWKLIVDGQPGTPVILPQVVSRHGDCFVAANNVKITPDAPLAACMSADVICVPELMVAPGESLDGRFQEEIACLQSCYAAGKLLATACSGAILLAEAGLLNGQEATTHWAYCDVMTRRYPLVKVRTQRALVASGEGQRLIMAGGGTSWLDLALYLVARLTSIEIAMQTARLNLVDWHDIGQQPFARLARTRQAEDALIARCQTWIADHYAEPAPVAAMVQLSGIAERSFKRRFQHATGMSPLEYVHTLRLEEAKQMLESGALPVEAIANQVGYEDPGFFSRLFRRHVCLTPAQYRKRFGTMRSALEMRR